jgi:uncharacterized protein YbjT (DUF2867 family)
MSALFSAAALFVSLAACRIADARPLEGPVVVSGATGRTGAFVYKFLKEKNVSVRGFVRSASKARDLLGCSKCDESEGIFLGDITRHSTLAAPLKGASSLVIATSAAPICNPYPKCHFPRGAHPIDLDWLGVKDQLATFAELSRGKGSVVLISTMGTTTPEAPTDPFDHISFYKLNFEAELMSSGLTFTIIKPCGLVDTAARAKELLAGHDDEMSVKPPIISRADVARVVVAALEQPTASEGLRFDLCSREGPPTQDGDLLAFLKSARYPWVDAVLV